MTLQPSVADEEPVCELMPETPPEPEDLAADLRSKALSAVTLVAGRNVAIKGLALLGNIAFARLLSPSSFGAVAFGLTVLLFAQQLSDGGLGVGLIRRPEPPHVDDLRALLGYQLVTATILALATGLGAALLGKVGLITALIVSALPLMALRAPSAIMFERSLNYRPLVRVEVIEELTYYAWGVATILLGAGVWGLASASVAKALVGTVIMLSVSPVARLRPSYSWRRLRPMLGFGIKYQAVELANVGGLQMLNIGVAGIGGLAVLGLWTLAWRIAQVPYLLFSSLWRVSYPAAAQLLSAGESARRMIERGLGLAAVATGAILAPATGAISPLVSATFGHAWGPAANVLPAAFFALQASGPVSVATAGYLYAVGDTGTVLRAAVTTSAVWLIVTLPLLHVIGVIAVGVGWMISSLVEMPILARPVRQKTGAAFLNAILVPWIVASMAGASGWIISRTVSHGFLAAAAGAAVAACVYAVPMILLRREDLLRILRLARGA